MQTYNCGPMMEQQNRVNFSVILKGILDRFAVPVCLSVANTLPHNLPQASPELMVFLSQPPEFCHGPFISLDYSHLTFSIYIFHLLELT